MVEVDEAFLDMTDMLGHAWENVEHSGSEMPFILRPHFTRYGALPALVAMGLALLHSICDLDSTSRYLRSREGYTRFVKYWEV